MMNYRYILVFPIVYCFLVALPSAQAAPTLQSCIDLSEDIPAANDCFYDYALETKDITICQRILWSPKTAICRQKLFISADAFSLSSFFSSPFFWLVVVWCILFYFRPPHLFFIYSSFIALPWFGMYLLLSNFHVPHALTASILYFLFYTLLNPYITSLQEFVPSIPFSIAFIVSAAIYSSIVFGLLFQWTKSSRQLLSVFLLLTILVHFYGTQMLQILSKLARLILLLFA